MSVAFPSLLREQRLRRRWSQEHPSLEARVSPRHLSCLETGKASPSREMVLMLARALDLDLRERNTLLLAAGYAASYPQSPLDGSGSRCCPARPRRPRRWPSCTCAAAPTSCVSSPC